MFFRCFALWLVLVSAACAPGEQLIEALDPLESPSGEGSRWPGLSSDADGVVLSWLEPGADDRWSFKVSRLLEDGWGPAHTVASEGDRSFFVNWADFPSVWSTKQDALAAHWLVRGPEGGYDYGIRMAFSEDDGATWSEPWTPHEDGTPTEHGFVSMFPVADGSVGLTWLDGRNFAGASAGHDANAEMTLRYRTASPHAAPGPEVLLDDRICDCCQTDAAVTSRGPVVVYRDRTDEEVRDIYLTRMGGDGWTEGHAVHDDGWVFPACPVNGPAVDAAGDEVVVAWFTGADQQPTVKVVFSDDAGDSFDAPIRIDGGNPLGRVDVLLLRDGAAFVSWIERSGRAAEIRTIRVESDGTVSQPTTVTETSAGRDSGFPRMIEDDKGRIVFAWTEPGEVTRIRVARSGNQGDGAK